MDGIRQIVKMAINHKNGKDAITHYKVLERFGEATYVECRLETGRTHQIRVHMASIGHPLLWGHGVWFIQKSLSSGGTGTSCNDPWICSSTYRGIYGIYSPTSGIFC